LSEPVKGKAGDVLEVTFHYIAGGSLRSLEKNMRARLIT